MVDPENPAGAPGVPPSLTAAAAVGALEGLLLLGLAVVQLANLSGDRVTMGSTTAGFFAVFGLLLLGCAWAVRRRHTWARGPLLLAHLFCLGLAWNFRDDVLVALALALVGVAGLAAMLHPATIEALADNPQA